eukprot:scaffold3199_cov165-Amphora_coffeaeformis.AAC.19
MPQQNSLAEVGFAIVMGKGRVLVAKANIPLKIRYKIVEEALKTATLLDRLMVTRIGDKEATRYKHYYGKLPQFVDHLRTFGEAGTVQVKKPGNTKDCRPWYLVYVCRICNKAFTQHISNVESKHNKILVTRDVIWLRCMFYNKTLKLEETAVNQPTLEIEEDEEEPKGTDPVQGPGLTQQDTISEGAVEENEDDKGGEEDYDNNSPVPVRHSERHVKPVSRMNYAKMGGTSMDKLNVSELQLC